ncbi:MAG: hypothetical protein J0H66_13730 [Solirubrobacterales bacterium]|nr:hypothetical protein [Solirubrobacterales bacterium]
MAAFACLGSERAGASVLVRQDAALTTANRASGMPTSTAPGRQLSKVTIGIETYGQDTSEPSYFVDAKIELAGQPIGDPDAELNLGFGHREGTVCKLAALQNQDTSDYSGSSYQFGGYNPDYFPTPSRPWDCVAVFLDDSFGGGPAGSTYDAFVGPLKDTRHSASLKITRVDLLGQKLGNLRLVRGVPTTIGVDFRNTGKVSTGVLRIKGSGKGIRGAPARVPKLSDDSSSSASIKVRLAGRQKRTRLRIVITDGSAKAVRTIRITRVRPPRRPVAGSYRSKSGNVWFTIRRGKIVGWRGTMITRCGGFPDNFTYTTNTYSHPSAKIPRNGIVQSVDRAELYTTSLRLRIAGSKVTRGLFTYYGPDRCFASVNFTAKRKGR